MERFQEQGRACYKRKEYDRAIELFDRALIRGQSAQLYDNRAACHEKLNDLNSALKDAKRAIQQQKEDPTGYLRAGRILRKMEKHKTALEIYSHGLKSVRHVGQGYELLKEAQRSVMENICPPKSVDPLTVLPRELAEQILNYLSFKQKMAICRVSRPWVNFIRSMPELWQHIDTSGANKKKVRSAFVSRAINCGRKRITKATLHNLMDLDKALKALLQFTSLQELILLDTGLQGSNMVEMLSGAKHMKHLHFAQGTEISQDSLRQLVESSPAYLESLTCEDVRIKSPGGIDFQNMRTPRTSLTAFSLRCGIMRLSSAFFAHLPTAMPNLQSLTIYETQHKMAQPDPFGLVDLRALTQLQSLSLHSATVGMSHNLKLPPSLRHLRFCSGRRLAGSFFHNISPAGGTNTYRLPKLEDLDADIFVKSFSDIANFLSEHGTWDDTSPTPEHTIEAPSRLRRLKLNWYNNDPNADGLETLLFHPRLSELEHFGLYILGSTNSDKIDLILARLRGLKSIDFSGTRLNGVDVKKIVQSGQIKTLVLNDCPDVPRDAVDWARTQGVDVECRMNGKKYDDGSRKVRH